MYVREERTGACIVFDLDVTVEVSNCSMSGAARLSVSSENAQQWAPAPACASAAI